MALAHIEDDGFDPTVAKAVEFVRLWADFRHSLFPGLLDPAPRGLTGTRAPFGAPKRGTKLKGGGMEEQFEKAGAISGRRAA